MPLSIGKKLSTLSMMESSFAFISSTLAEGRKHRSKFPLSICPSRATFELHKHNYQRTVLNSSDQQSV